MLRRLLRLLPLAAALLGMTRPAFGQRTFVPLGTTVQTEDLFTFHPTTNVLTNADSIPTCSIYEDNNDTPMSTANMTLRTGQTGHYRFSFQATAANGYELGKWYNVVCQAQVAGLVNKYDLAHFMILATPDTVGYLVSTLKPGTAAGEVSLTSGAVAVNSIVAAAVNSIRDSILSDATRFAGANIDAAITSRGSPTVKRATAFQWPMLFAVSGVPVTGQTPSCKRSLDAPMSTGASGTTNSASSTTDLGYSEITLSTTDTAATDYMVLYCTAGAAVYQSVFKIQAP